jgi:hypothetical protein
MEAQAEVTIEVAEWECDDWGWSSAEDPPLPDASFLAIAREKLAARLRGDFPSGFPAFSWPTVADEPSEAVANWPEGWQPGEAATSDRRDIRFEEIPFPEVRKPDG